MKPAYSHAGVDLHCGDCRSVLAELEPESVQCCVTSPPYYGLRDYGTATWDGGDPVCAHRGRDARTGAPGTPKQASNFGANEVYSGDCICGARRIDAQIGLEQSPAAYVDTLVDVFRAVRRVLRADGTLWLNLGSSYAGAGYSNHANTGGAQREDGGKQQHTAAFRAGNPEKNGGVSNRDGFQAVAGFKPKDLIPIPWLVGLALQQDGWYLRSDIIWHKPDPMPESVQDRPTKAHEYLFLLAKSERYFYDADAIAEATASEWFIDQARRVQRLHATGGAITGGTGEARSTGTTRNKRSVWTVNPEPFSDRIRTSRLVRVTPDDADDDTQRIPSSDCPVHADSIDQDSMAQCDERASVLAELRRSLGSDDRLERELLAAPAPTERRHGADSASDNSDSLRRRYAHAATDHSSESHRTARDPATTAPCTASGQTADDTEHTLASRGFADSVAHTRASNSAQDDSADHPLVQTTDRNGGTASCTCILYKRVYAESISHFATYPAKLIEPCILAGSRPGDVVLDPFSGAGTTALVAKKLGRRAIGIELNPEYVAMTERRLSQDVLPLEFVS